VDAYHQQLMRLISVLVVGPVVIVDHSVELRITISDHYNDIAPFVMQAHALLQYPVLQLQRCEYASIDQYRVVYNNANEHIGYRHDSRILVAHTVAVEG